MKKLSIILILLLLPLGCVSLDSLVPEFLDDEEEECWDENWQGTQPKSLVTPEGYSYQCGEITDMYLGANGDYSDSDESGTWTRSFNGRFCIKYDPQSQCLFSCQSFTQIGDTLSFTGYKHYWRKEEYLGGDERPDTCVLLKE